MNNLGILKKKKFLSLLLTTEAREQNYDFNTFQQILLFLVEYAFILNDTTSDNIFFKREFLSSGEPSTKNSKGARYLDPKYSRWISTDPALGEYVPAAGKSNEADKLPGMGGIYNSVNLSLYHYAGNNPVKYVDPDGKQVEADLEAYMREYSELCSNIADLVEMTFSNSNADGLSAFIDNLMGGEKGKLAVKYQFKVDLIFLKIQLEYKASGRYDFDKNGKYDETEVRFFTDSVNSTMLMNYSDKKALGPYANYVSIPLLNDSEAEKFLNDKSIKFSDKKMTLLIHNLKKRIEKE